MCGASGWVPVMTSGVQAGVVVCGPAQQRDAAAPIEVGVP
jgi:hypothetical protein